MWKAWIEGHPFDLETLQELFSAGDPLVAQDASDGYYFESVTLENSGGQIDSIGAQALVKRINGIGCAADSGFQPVSLTGRRWGRAGRSRGRCCGCAPAGRLGRSVDAVTVWSLCVLIREQSAT